MTDVAHPDAPAAPRASLWEDFIDIFYAPREVYERRREGRFGLVLLVFTLLTAVLFFAMQGPLADVFAAEFQRNAPQAAGGAGQMTAEQLAQARRMATIFGMLGVLVGVPLAVIATGAVLWAVGKLFEFSGTLGMAILVVTYAQIPRLLQSLGMLLQGLLGEPRSLAATSVGPARFLDPDTASATLVAILMRLDVFYVWSTILIAIGAQVIGRVPPARSYLLAVIVWAAGALPTLAGAMLR